jgi:hypothetical protein
MVLKCVLCSALAFVVAAYSGRFPSHVSAGQCSGPCPTQSEESLALVQRHASALTSLVHADETTPIYRYYSASTSDHFYAKSAVTPGGYVSEGVEFHAFATEVAGTVPIYRYYASTSTGDHFYSKSATAPGGYVPEGVEFYAFATQVQDTVPIYRYYASTDHFYSKSAATPGGYVSEGVEFYAYAAPASLPTPASSTTCSDTLDWTNGNKKDCAYYGQQFCADGGPVARKGWTLGATYNYPENNCCACGKGTTPQFQQIQTGTCSDHGRSLVHDKATCETAAAALGLYDTSANEGTWDDVPEGCYYKPGAAAGSRLQFNAGGVGQGCDNAREQICGPIEATAAQDPTTESPTQSPTRPPTHAPACASWCEGSTREWSSKCVHNICSQCSACVVENCEPWCLHSTRPWETICTFSKTCGGCNGC